MNEMNWTEHDGLQASFCLKRQTDVDDTIKHFPINSDTVDNEYSTKVGRIANNNVD